jgi:hypothetical protein
VKVKESELSELLRFDASLIDLANDVKSKTSTLRERARGHEFEKLFILSEQYEVGLDEIVLVLTRRDEVILGLQKGATLDE